MYPAEPLYAFEASANDLRARFTGQSAIPSEVKGVDATTALLLDRIDGSILEMRRPKLHRQLARLPGMACHLFRAGGEICGYAYVSAKGQVGPVAALAALSFAGIFETALRLAAAVSQDRVTAILAGCNAPAMAAAIQNGLRIVRPVLLMASPQFGDWSRCAPYSPGVM